MRGMEPTLNRRDFAIAAGAGLAAAGMPAALMAQQSTPAPLVEHYDVTGIVHRFSVGGFECLAACDGASLNNDPNDPFNFYNLILGVSPDDEVRTWLGAGGYDADNLIKQDTCLLIDTGTQHILIDTGIGTAFGGVLTSNLAGEGYLPEDIDVVITTHGHPDHIGGNVDASGAPTFPNARYVMSETEWNFWSDDALVEQAMPDASLREPVLGFVNAQMVPIADRYDLIGFDEEIVPGVTSIATPGHTPGHMSLLVESAGEHLWVAADIAGHPVLMRNPTLTGYADIDLELTEATRRRMFKRMAEGGLALFGHFDPFPGLGRVAADGNAWVWNLVPNEA